MTLLTLLTIEILTVTACQKNVKSGKLTTQYQEIFFVVYEISLVVGYFILFFLTKMSYNIVKVGKMYDEHMEDYDIQRRVNELGTISTDKDARGFTFDDGYDTDRKMHDTQFDSESAEIRQFEFVVNNNKENQNDPRTSLFESTSVQIAQKVAKGGLEKFNSGLKNFNRLDSVRLFSQNTKGYSYGVLGLVQDNKFVDKVFVKLDNKGIVGENTVRKDMEMGHSYGDDKYL